MNGISLPLHWESVLRNIDSYTLCLLVPCLSFQFERERERGGRQKAAFADIVGRKNAVRIKPISYSRTFHSFFLWCPYARLRRHSCSRRITSGLLIHPTLLQIYPAVFHSRLQGAKSYTMQIFRPEIQTSLPKKEKCLLHMQYKNNACGNKKTTEIKLRIDKFQSMSAKHFVL